MYTLRIQSIIGEKENGDGRKRIVLMQIEVRSNGDENRGIATHLILYRKNLWEETYNKRKTTILEHK